MLLKKDDFALTGDCKLLLIDKNMNCVRANTGRYKIDWKAIIDVLDY